MEDRLEKYREVFKEPFPLMLVQSMPEKALEELINQCIATGQKYEPELANNAEY